MVLRIRLFREIRNKVMSVYWLAERILTNAWTLFFNNGLFSFGFTHSWSCKQFWTRSNIWDDSRHLILRIIYSNNNIHLLIIYSYCFCIYIRDLLNKCPICRYSKEVKAHVKSHFTQIDLEHCCTCALSYNILAQFPYLQQFYLHGVNHVIIAFKMRVSFYENLIQILQ